MFLYYNSFSLDWQKDFMSPEHTSPLDGCLYIPLFHSLDGFLITGTLEKKGNMVLNNAKVQP